ncbi:MAG: amidohydrolase family protein [Bryobacteraceae bacterium]|nr:amidohydrolase family protein [Bryobacteraceae bacterium]
MARLLLLIGAVCLAAQERIVIRAGALADVEAGVLRSRVAIVIQAGRIESVGPYREFPGARVLDLSSYTVLPGLMDARVSFSPDPAAARTEALATLRAGFTTVRSAGAARFRDVELRDGIAKGILPGPRVLAAGAPLASPGGACDAPFAGEGLFNRLDVKIRGVLDSGVDWVPACAGGAMWPSASDRMATELSEAELRSVVRLAHSRKRRVAVHAQGPNAIRNAARAGADSVEHGNWVDEGSARELARRGIPLVPGLARLSRPGEAPRLRAEVFRAVRTAIALGVPLVFGSDAPGIPHGDNAREFGALIEAGLTPDRALRSATLDAARMLGEEKKAGRVAKGYRADLIAVEGDPLHDWKTLTRVRFVMKEGIVIRRP